MHLSLNTIRSCHQRRPPFPLRRPAACLLITSRRMCDLLHHPRFHHHSSSSSSSKGKDKMQWMKACLMPPRREAMRTINRKPVSNLRQRHLRCQKSPVSRAQARHHSDLVRLLRRRADRNLHRLRSLRHLLHRRALRNDGPWITATHRVGCNGPARVARAVRLNKRAMVPKMPQIATVNLLCHRAMGGLRRTTGRNMAARAPIIGECQAVRLPGHCTAKSIQRIRAL